jgi:hypothetical protein
VPSLVIFDSRFDGETLKGTLEYVESAEANQRLRVRWNVKSQPEDFRSVGGGVAYIKGDKISVEPISNDAEASYLGDSRYRWEEGLQPGRPWLMFILIVPENHTLTDPDPLPADTKTFANRLALYWLLKGDEMEHTNVKFTIKKLQTDLASEITKFNSRYLSKQVPTPSTISVDQENGGKRPWGEIVLYALITLVCFLGAVGILALMIWKGDQLVAWGLTGNLYFLVLVPMALCVAGFLFGVLHSYARYSGNQLGGVLELGGPIVGAALVVIGGFWLVPSVATFPLTVYVQGEGGPSEVVLKNSGSVVLDLGGDRRRQPIGEEGQAYFPSIPATFRNQEVPIWVESDAYALNNPKEKHRLAP